jgi:phage regulator Rha-like protein
MNKRIKNIGEWIEAKGKADEVMNEIFKLYNANKEYILNPNEWMFCVNESNCQLLLEEFGMTKGFSFKGILIQAFSTMQKTAPVSLKKRCTSFEMTFSAGEMRKIAKRKSEFSTTIIIEGSSDNNNLF